MRKLACVLALLAGCGGAGSKDGTSTSIRSTTSSKSPWPDACSLLTQAEAEAVLGTLVRAPHADSSRNGCAYETAGHDWFVIVPEWTYGKFQLDTERMIGGLVNMVARTQDAVADTVEGPWDEAAFGVRDLVFRVKARALTVTYANSGTDIAGAVRLASLALPRMAAVPEPERPEDSSGKCPLSAETVSEIIGQEVRLAVGQGMRQDACDFDLVLDPTIQVELKIQPEAIAEMVFENMAAGAKGFMGPDAELTKINVGEGGVAFERKGGGGEAAARANGKVYYARMALGIISSASVPEGAMVKLVERMIH
ncbi:MAG TPA: hypothetical protein VJU15_14140 [Gemmatimonadales bacterium]|nr:hypothetical protein [Gemmatimonadales bacterium]